MHQEPGLESLKDRRWLKRLCQRYKSVSSKLAVYFYDIAPVKGQSRPACMEVIRLRAELCQKKFSTTFCNRMQ